METKRNEKSRLCHLATAGRDQLQRHVLRKRTEALGLLEKAKREHGRVNKMQVSALAWKRMPHLVMIPDNEIGKVLGAKAAAGSRQSGCKETLQTYIRDNKNELMNSLAEMKLKAAEAVVRATPDCPTTTGDWLDYMEKHKDEFRDRMRTATAERRQRSKRFSAREDIAAPAKRMQPKPMASRVQSAPWMDLLSERHGWHALVSKKSKDLTVIFVAAYEKGTFALDVSDFCENREIELSGDFQLSEYLKPLNQLDGSFQENGVFATLEICLSARARGDKWVLALSKVCQVEAQVRQRRKKAERDQEQASQESDGASESSSGVSDDLAARKPSSGSSCGDSYQSVDSDVDSAVLSADGDSGHQFSEVEDEEQQEEHPHGMDQPAEEEEDIAAGIERHASGTWKVWEDLWFYRTETPGFTDIKMHLKRSFCTDEHMGRTEMSKALSPHHYGETRDNPVKTRLLLQAWAIYRARLKAGWAEARPGRGRHVASMMVSLKTAIRAADTRQRLRVPLLEHPAAHKWLEKWVPDLVQELLRSS